MKNRNDGVSQLQVDWTHWSMPDRVELLAKIDEIVDRIALSEPADLTVVPTPVPGPSVVIPDDVVLTGWTYEAYEKVMLELIEGHYYAQAYVINEAIVNGTGYVSREKVYDIGTYPESRLLNGFTRPVNRIVGEVVDQGLLHEDAADLLVPDYPNGGRAQGFFVPLEVVKLVLEHNTESAEATA